MSNTPTDTFASLVEKASHSADQVTPMLERAGEQVSSLTRHGLDSVRETSHQLKMKAERASDNTVGYIRHEPVKSVLIAAATGAALMALVSLVARSRSQH